MNEARSICFVARNDFETKPGGDTVKWRTYQAAASEAGWETLQWFDDASLPDAALYHAINLDRPYDLYPKMQRVHASGRPFIISSIHRPNAWLEKFRRAHPPHGWAGRLLYRSPLGNRVGRSETIKDAVRLVQQRRLRHWKEIFPGWTARAQWLIRNARKILLLSWREAEAFAPDFHLPLSADKMRLVPNWLSALGGGESSPPAVFLDFPEPPVIVVGRIEAAKNSLKLARLAGRLGRPLVFIGQRNPYEPAYGQEFQQAVAVHRCLRWIPGVPREALAGYYEHAAFLLNASYFEGCPWVDMEALYFNCPLITTRYALHHEFLPADVPKCDPYNDQELTAFLQSRPARRGPLQPINPQSCKTELMNLYSELSRTCSGRGAGARAAVL